MLHIYMYIPCITGTLFKILAIEYSILTHLFFFSVFGLYNLQTIIYLFMYRIHEVTKNIKSENTKIQMLTFNCNKKEGESDQWHLFKHQNIKQYTFVVYSPPII